MKRRITCSIVGCTRTHETIGSAWICGIHWRRHCPPRSLRRRAYHRFFRKAKREGWTPELTEQYWRFWDTLVRLANAREAGDRLDMTEINRMFGWTDD